MEILSPETWSTLAQLGAVTLTLLVVLGILALINKIVSPMAAISTVVRDSQNRLVDSQDKIVTVIEKNTDSHEAMLAFLAKMSDESLALGTEAIVRLDDLQAYIRRQEAVVKTGVIIFGPDKNVLFANQRALDVLGGWEIDQLPGGKRRFKQDILDALHRVLPEEWFPSHRAADTGLLIENIPLEIFDYSLNRYKWVMVSAYPCISCQSGASTKADWVTLILEELGDLLGQE